MYVNKNSGLGLLMAQAVFGQAIKDNPTTGRVFIVAKSGITNESEIKALYGNNYPDGTPVIYTTIDSAVGSCLASRNDVILVAPGHTETISSATALALDVAGVTIVGIGSGSLAPTLTLDTAATTKIPVSAANVTVRGIKFVANFADIATVFLLTTAQGFTVDDCEFTDTTSILNFLAIITTTVSVVADNLTFTNNKVIGLGTTAATTPIKVLGTHNRLVITNNYVNLAGGNICALLTHGALVVTNAEIYKNRVIRMGGTDFGTVPFLVSTSSTTNTGMINDNYCQHADVAGAILVTAGSVYGMFNNLNIGDADASGFVLPAIGAN